MATIIDTHIHFWNYHPIRDDWITDDMKMLQKNFLPQDIAPLLQKKNVDGAIAVQADQSEAETQFLVQLAQNHTFIKGVVGWVDLRNENIEDRLEYFSQFPIIKGWRHIIQAEPDDFFLDENFSRGIQLLKEYHYTYDILIYPKQLKSAITFVEKFPEQKFVIDHCAKPNIKNKEMVEWKVSMQTMALHPHAYCKLSGLLTEADWNQWSADDLFPYLDVLFESFGPDRLMYGSDWPVMLLSGQYAQWKSLLEKYLESYAPEEKENIFGNNAARFYNL